MTETPTKAPAKLPASLRKALMELDLGGKPDSVRLTLKELVKAAEVSERTVRYYIQEGVLPPPIGSGPASRYGLEHLTRLSLVRRFKAALLPLSRIKQLFEELTLEELDQVANQVANDFYSEITTTSQVTNEGQAQPNPVLSISPQLQAMLVRAQLKHSDQPLEVFQPPDANSVVRKNEASNAQTLVEATSQPNPNVLSFARYWQRIELVPGLEIHYEVGGSQDTSEGRQRLNQLVEMALRLYSSR